MMAERALVMFTLSRTSSCAKSPRRNLIRDGGICISMPRFVFGKFVDQNQPDLLLGQGAEELRDHILGVAVPAAEYDMVLKFSGSHPLPSRIFFSTNTEAIVAVTSERSRRPETTTMTATTRPPAVAGETSP